VSKVQHKPTKEQIRLQKKGAKRKPKCALVWCTGLSGVPPDSVRCTTRQCPVHQGETAQTHQLRAFQALLGYNSPDCLVCHRTVRCTSGATLICTQRSTLTDEQCSTVSRQESEQRVRGAPDCPVCHRTVRCHMRTKPPTVDQLQALTTG
jgi:hypothetical protein